MVHTARVPSSHQSQWARMTIEFEALVSPGVGERSLERLSIRRGGVWPFGKRFDVVARFGKETSVAIDSIADYGDESEIFTDEKEQIATLVSSGSNTRSATLISYFSTNSITWITARDIPLNTDSITLRN
jgi:hypothetical protein